MKSTLTGLCKLSGDECPTEITLELIAIDVSAQSGSGYFVSFVFIVCHPETQLDCTTFATSTHLPHTKQAFEKADKNGDNKITLQEFLDYCAEDPECTSDWML